MEVGWYVSKQHLLETACGQCIQGKYVFLQSRVFKNNYIGVILTKKCPWDDLSSDRTRKNILLEIQSGKKKLIRLATFSAWSNLTLSFSADFSGSCTHMETLLAPGKSSESNGLLSQERERA